MKHSANTQRQPATQYLTQTNSLGVVTGQPTLSNGAVATVAETSQPALATIPAGLPTGINTVYIGGGNQTASSFLVSVGSSTTVVVGSTSTGTTGTGASPTGGNDDESSTGTSNEPSGTDSSSSETSSSAANANVLVSGAIFGLGALFAALL